MSYPRSAGRARGHHLRHVGHAPVGTGGGDRPGLGSAQSGAVQAAMAAIGVKPPGAPSPRDEALNRLRQGASHAGEPQSKPTPDMLNDNRLPTDGQFPWWSTMPQSMQNGGAGRAVPRMVVPDVKQRALDEMQYGTIGRGATRSLDGPHGNMAGPSDQADLTTTLDMIRQRLARKGVKGDVTVDASGQNVIGPKGRKYPVFHGQGA